MFAHIERTQTVCTQIEMGEQFRNFLNIFSDTLSKADTLDATQPSCSSEAAALHPSVRRKLWGGALWSPSCFAASCGGAPIEIVRQYIEQQRTPR